MSIVIDSHIPFLVEAVHNEWPDVRIYPMEPEQIHALSVRDADVLVVRTRTRVDEALLSGSRVRLVCTATIGYDHIDTSWCEAHGIQWVSCPGCNAQAVCDYIEEAIDEFKAEGQAPQVIGVVGVGHVGSLVAQMAERRGMNVLCNDPPLGMGVSLDEIAQKSDIITFHVPLSKDGAYPTFHLCDESFLARCKPHALIINAARGGVVDEQALLRSGHPYILDTWENEPYVNTQVLAHATFASMHIAGYSEQGKRNASRRCLDAIAELFGRSPIVLPSSSPRKPAPNGWLAAVSEQLKAHPEQFESLRRNYPLR